MTPILVAISYWLGELAICGVLVLLLTALAQVE